MASLLLAALVVQTKGIKFYDLQTSGTCGEEHVSLVRRPDSVYDVNCLDVRLFRGRFLLGHTEAPIASRLFLIRCDVPVEMYSRLRFPSHVRIIIKNYNNNKNNLCERLICNAKKCVMQKNCDVTPKCIA